MKISFYEKFIACLSLLSGLSISAVAVYYSVAGLVSIFSASVIPIIIMGVTLELSKLVATLWLKQNWSIAPRIIKVYLFTAVIILMTITSMGIFGYLSKAHLDQAVPSSIIIDQISIIDDKINTLKENINDARKSLAQMDSTVDQTIARSTSEAGAGRAASLRKSQSKERSLLQTTIEKAQLEITKLISEKAPLTKEIKKVEAEVGPIKYIAALIYGDDITENLLERAVRWVIVLIVLIFDPLAVALLLASQYSFSHFRLTKANTTSVVTEKVKSPIKFSFKPLTKYTYHKSYIDKIGLYDFSTQHTDTKEIESKNLPVTDIINNGTEDNIVSQITYDVSDINLKSDNKELNSEELKKKIITDQEKEAKRRYKLSNPKETIHSLERKKELGLIDQLPWENNDI